MSQQRFVDAMSPALERLSQDLKAILKLVEDPEIDDESRLSLAGGLLYVVSQPGAIPGVRGVLKHVGDVLLLRLAIDELRKRSPEAFAVQLEALPELLSTLDEELEAAAEYVGDGMKVLNAVAEKFPKVQHQGHSAQTCVDDINWLHAEVHEASLDRIDFDEQDVNRELKQIDRILGPLQAKAKRL